MPCGVANIRKQGGQMEDGVCRDWKMMPSYNIINTIHVHISAHSIMSITGGSLWSEEHGGDGLSRTEAKQTSRFRFSYSPIVSWMSNDKGEGHFYNSPQLTLQVRNLWINPMSPIFELYTHFHKQCCCCGSHIILVELAWCSNDFHR